MGMVTGCKNVSNSLSLPESMPFPGGSEALPIPLNPVALVICFSQENADSESLPGPTYAFRPSVLPFALLDLASSGEQSQVSLLQNESPAEQTKAIPDLQAPDILLADHKHIREPSWGRPSLASISNTTSLTHSCMSKTKCLLIHAIHICGCFYAALLWH